MFLWESVEFYSQRWLLFYNQDTQRALVQKLGLERWDNKTFLSVLSGFCVLMFLCARPWSFIRRSFKQDPLLFIYHRLQKDMQSIGVSIVPPAILSPA